MIGVIEQPPHLLFLDSDVLSSIHPMKHMNGASYLQWWARPPAGACVVYTLVQVRSAKTAFLSGISAVDGASESNAKMRCSIRAHFMWQTC